MALITPVFSRVLVPAAGSAKRKRSGAVGMAGQGAIADTPVTQTQLMAELVQENIQEATAFAVRAGRWRRELMNALSDPLFFVVNRVCRLVHAPGSHHLNFLQKRLGPEEVEAHGNHLCQL
eukprot:423342-Alexandrium_andersonii.AAC.1